MNQANILKKIRELNLLNKRKEAIEIARNYLAKEKNDEVLLELAFLLYHEAANFFYKNKNKKTADVMFKEAISILKMLLSRHTSKRVMTNSKIYLAQIYAILGNKLAIKIGKENFKTTKNAVMANRLADIYDRLSENNKALWWYKRSDRLAQTPEEKIMTKQGLSNFYRKINNDKLSKQYREEALSLIEKHTKKIEKESMKKILNGATR